jgi:NitT/TauT family transport system substrate-binding protein
VGRLTSGVQKSVAAAVVIGLLLLSACSSDKKTSTPAGSSGATPAKVTKVTQTGLLPFFSTVWPTVVAQHEGFFKAHGLDVTFAWGFEGAQTFAGGNAEILLDSSEQSLMMQVGGLDVVVFKPIATHVTTWLVSKNNITSIEQLKGKKLAVSEINGTDHFMTVELLKKHGLGPTDVDYVKIPSEQQLASLASGNIDAAVPDEVFALQASKAGEVKLLAKSEDYSQYPWTLLHAQRSWIQQNLEAAKGYVAAVDEAIKFILNTANKDKVIADVIAESGGAAERATVEPAYDLVVATPNYYSDKLDASIMEFAKQALIFNGALEANKTVDIPKYLSGLTLVK